MLSQSYTQRDRNIRIALDKFNNKTNKNIRIIRELSTHGASAAIYVVDNDGEEIIMKGIDTAISDFNVPNDAMIKVAIEEAICLDICEDCDYVIDLIQFAFFPVGNSSSMGPMVRYNINDKILELNPNQEYVFLIFLPLLECVATKFANNASADDVIAMAKDVCKALSYCHERRKLHRDIKPQNIYYDKKKKRYVIADFGVARSVLKNQAVTQVGTNLFLAPEIRHHQKLNDRFNADIYSLAITIFSLIGGYASSENDIINRCNFLEPKSLRNILLKAKEQDPAVRYQTADEFFNELEKFCKGKPRAEVPPSYKEKPTIAHKPNVPPVARKRDAASTYEQMIARCVDAFTCRNWPEAEKIAREGHMNGNKTLSCLFAYILQCKGDAKKALDILTPLKNNGDEVACCIYGIILRTKGLDTNDVSLANEGLDYILYSMKKEFSVAQYYIGRWVTDGQAGLLKNVVNGYFCLSESSKQGFLPAKAYMIKSLKRKAKKSEVYDADETIRMLQCDLSVKKYDDALFADYVFQAIANHYSRF